MSGKLSEMVGRKAAGLRVYTYDSRAAAGIAVCNGAMCLVNDEYRAASGDNYKQESDV